MKKNMPPDELARDGRFVRVNMVERISDPRNGRGPTGGRVGARLTPDRPGAPDAARALMHGIFVGEIQALEGAGRTCWDFEVGAGPDDVPFQLKLDMARQCWDEARHCETAFLYQAACNPDPVLRLTGVNRALEGLVIDVFNTMKEFGNVVGGPVLEFCEDWMLADEVTHVKMGSDWLRRLTVDDPERRKRALEFQRIVDKLFSGGGFRGDDEDSPVHLARRFREMAGFTVDEIDEISDLARQARAEARARTAGTAGAAAEAG